MKSPFRRKILLDIANARMHQINSKILKFSGRDPRDLLEKVQIFTSFRRLVCVPHLFRADAVSAPLLKIFLSTPLIWISHETFSKGFFRHLVCPPYLFQAGAASDGDRALIWAGKRYKFQNPLWVIKTHNWIQANVVRLIAFVNSDDKICRHFVPCSAKLKSAWK